MQDKQIQNQPALKKAKPQKKLTPEQLVRKAQLEKQLKQLDTKKEKLLLAVENIIDLERMNYQLDALKNLSTVKNARKFQKEKLKYQGMENVFKMPDFNNVKETVEKIKRTWLKNHLSKTLGKEFIEIGKASQNHIIEQVLENFPPEMKQTIESTFTQYVKQLQQDKKKVLSQLRPVKLEDLFENDPERMIFFVSHNKDRQQIDTTHFMKSRETINIDFRKNVLLQNPQTAQMWKSFEEKFQQEFSKPVPFDLMHNILSETFKELKNEEFMKKTLEPQRKQILKNIGAFQKVMLNNLTPVTKELLEDPRISLKAIRENSIVLDKNTRTRIEKSMKMAEKENDS